MECGDEIPEDILCSEESITELHLTDEHSYEILKITSQIPVHSEHIHHKKDNPARLTRLQVVVSYTMKPPLTFTS